MKFRSLFWAVALPAAAACAHTQPSARSEAPAAPVAAAQPAPVATPVTAQVARTCSTDDQCADKEICDQTRCVGITSDLDVCRLQSVHFDLDRADISQADRQMLQLSARCLLALPPEVTLVAGNCDERGTAEYNVALGFRRAHAVTKYLSDLGVPASRLDEVSYGKEIPMCTESTETCWATNRRTDVGRGVKPKDVRALVRADESRDRNSMRTKSDPVAKAGN